MWTERARGAAGGPWLLAILLALLGPLAARSEPLTYAAAQRLVQIEAGRRLNLVCAGHGRPTVILEAGLSDPALMWFRVQPQLAARWRTCAYDRAGLGFSDPSPHPSTAGQLARDLDTLLRNGEVPGPYVLVGHGFGALDLRLFAAHRARDVVGLVLVDPAHEDQEARFAAAAGGPDPKRLARFEIARRCADVLTDLQPGDELFDTCVVAPDPRLPPDLNATRRTMEARASFQRAQLSEFAHLLSGESGAELRATDRRLTAPMIVLSRTVHPASLRPDELTPQLTTLWALHDELAAWSSRGRHLGVAATGPEIQIDRPEAVIAAVAEIVAEAQARHGRP
jgi:pimeloyl-ACP methyl ester carboxylesterase